MATTITGINQSKVISNLDTYNHTALTTNMYSVKCEISEIPASGVTIAIKQNSTTVVTSAVPAATQSHVVIATVLNCTANDVIGIVVSSAVANDARPNQIKGLINIHVGTP